MDLGPPPPDDENYNNEDDSYVHVSLEKTGRKWEGGREQYYVV